MLPLPTIKEKVVIRTPDYYSHSIFVGFLRLEAHRKPDEYIFCSSIRKGTYVALALEYWLVHLACF